MNEQYLRDYFPAANRTVHIVRGALRSLRQHVIENDVTAHVEGLTTNEALKHLLANPAERKRVFVDVQREITSARRQAAGVALHSLRSVQQYIADWRSWVERTRRDVALSFGGALDHMTPGDMVNLGIYELMLQPVIENASVEQLRERYPRALESRSARGLVECTLIEARVRRGGLARTQAQITVLRELADMIEGVQDLRLPDSLPDFETLGASISQLQERANVLEVAAVNPEQDLAAASTYRELEPGLLEAGTSSDREAMEALRELAEAAGQ